MTTCTLKLLLEVQMRFEKVGRRNAATFAEHENGAIQAPPKVEPGMGHSLPRNSQGALEPVPVPPTKVDVNQTPHSEFLRPQDHDEGTD
jgi:hypothetical protein